MRTNTSFSSRRWRTHLAAKSSGVQVLDTIFLHLYIEACGEEVERRIESAEASEYWNDDSNQSRVEEWTLRYEEIDSAILSWEEASDYAINNWTDLDQHEFMEIVKSEPRSPMSDFMNTLKVSPVTRFK